MIEKKISKIDKKIDKMRKRVKGVEDYKVANEVFDNSTLLTLYHFAKNGSIDILHGVIKAGKEANVFLADDRNGRKIAVKIYMVTASDFRNMLKYIEGDRRFRGFHKNRRGIIYTWVKKEFKNLERAHEAGVMVPEPIAFRNNVLLMDFIGTNGKNAPMLKNIEVEDPEKILSDIIEDYNKLYCKANLVHSDLSEYNILIKDNSIPYLIDFSQAVIREHPGAADFLNRDVKNLTRYFKKYFDVAEEEIYKRITLCG
ncbi:MAG TPA: serine protein kinase RIO [Euryarchaeota archaeon]|nr:3-deoxy-D-manno-octulosonic-acid kinase [archaeon BMS3Bbin15]HDL14720.1 serine protein kinase RIO [Euryarchaeota archaeon]